LSWSIATRVYPALTDSFSKLLTLKRPVAGFNRADYYRHQELTIAGEQKTKKDEGYASRTGPGGTKTGKK
jgi:hypothetical protein